MEAENSSEVPWWHTAAVHSDKVQCWWKTELLYLLVPIWNNFTHSAIKIQFYLKNRYLSALTRAWDQLKYSNRNTKSLFQTFRRKQQPWLPICAKQEWCMQKGMKKSPAKDLPHDMETPDQFSAPLSCESQGLCHLVSASVCGPASH